MGVTLFVESKVGLSTVITDCGSQKNIFLYDWDQSFLISVRGQGRYQENEEILLLSSCPYPYFRFPKQDSLISYWVLIGELVSLYFRAETLSDNAGSL